MLSKNLTQEDIKEELKQDISHMLKGNIFIDDQTSLIKFGLESLDIMKILAKWMKAGYKVSFSSFIENPTLEKWSILLFENRPTISKEIKKPNVNFKEPFDLTDVQYAYWIGRKETETLGGVGCHGYVEIDTQILNLEKLNKAWLKIFEIHPMLKAKFTESGQQQVLDEPFHKEVIVHNFSQYEDKGKSLETFRNETSHRLMRVDLGEVVCLQYIIINDETARLCFDIDLLVCDVHSFKMILSDLATYYNDINSQHGHEESWNFAEYLAYKQQSDQAQKEKDEAYWLSQLQKMPDAPHLPVIKPLNQVVQPKFNRRSTIVPPDQLELMKKIGKQHGVTLPMILLTLYARTIAKWSNNKRFLLNLPIFDRDSSIDIQHVVADFTNLLLLDIDMSQTKSLAENMKELQNNFHERMKHISYSGIRVMRDLQKQRGKSFMSPVVFSSNLGDALVDENFIQTFGDISYMISQTPQAYLDFQVFNKDGGLYIVWDSIDELFPDGLVDDMFEYFKEELILCQSSMAEIYTHKTQNELRREQERQAFKVSNNYTQTIPQKFIEIAQLYPQKCALINGLTNEVVSYQELLELVNHIAGYLQHKGVQPGNSVAIKLPKGPEYVASMIAVMLMGCSYIPIGPHQPYKRIEQILNHSDITHLIIQNEISSNFENKQQFIISIEEAIRYENEVLPPAQNVSDLAYIIFTSGSTGKPKGVKITHQQVLNTIEAVQYKCQMDSKDIVMNVSQFDFDLSVFDVFGPLMIGASMCYVEDQYWRDSQKWLEVLKKHPITIWNSVPTLMKMLLTEMKHKLINQHSLRYALLSGDWIDGELPTHILEVFPNSKVLAMGGATEASIWSNFIELERPAPTHWHTIPYGKPLPNQIYRIVNDQGKDANDYEEGELWIGGAGVAEGYFNQPTLTREQFVNEDGVRWYKTGDKGRFWRDDTIEFLGRLDNQVSLRGHRIELGEIDSAIKRVRGIDQSASIIKDFGGQKQIISFVTFDSDQLQQNPYIKKIKSFKSFDAYRFMNNIPFNYYLHESIINTINQLTKACIERVLLHLEKSKVIPGYQLLVKKWEELNGKISINEGERVSQDRPLKEELSNIIKLFERYMLDIVYGYKRPNELLIDKDFPGISRLIEVVEAGRWVNQILNSVYKHIMQNEMSNKSILVYGTQSLNGVKENIKNKAHKWTYIDSSLYYINKEQEIPKEVSCYVDNLELKNIPEDITFDVIILNNELHRVSNPKATLKQLEKKLNPGGFLLVTELTEPLSMQYITTALLDEVETEKDLNPLLSHDTWVSIFNQSEFHLRNMYTDQNELGSAYLYVLQKSTAYQFNEESIKTFLSDTLPYYMIPSQIQTLADIPITANGKVDRKKLLAYDNKQSQDKNSDIATSQVMTSYECKLSQLWENQLHQLPEPDDDYFKLGGDSLLATQLRNDIKQTFGVTIELEDVFKFSKLKDMANIIEKSGQRAIRHQLPDVKDNSPYDKFSLTEVQQAYILGRSGAFEFGDVSSHCYFELETEHLDVNLLESAWNKLIQKHLSLRTVICEDQLSQKVLKEVNFYNIEYIDLRQINNGERQALKVRNQLEHQNFNPYKWPSFEIKYLDLSSQKGRICVSFDNLFFDGFSMFQLFKEWRYLYEHPHTSLTSNQTTFKSYVESFEQYKKTVNYLQDLEYWENKIPSIFNKPDLNINHSPTSHRFKRNSNKLSADEWAKIKEKSKYYGLTPAGVLLTVYAEILARWSKSQQFTINLTRFDRLPFNEAVQNIIGDFTTLTLLSVDMAKGDSFIDRAKRLQEELWECMSHSSVSGITVQRLMNKNNKNHMTMPIVFTSGLGINGKSTDAIGSVQYGLSQTPQVWMDLQVFEDETGLNIALDSIKDLFEQGMVDEMFKGYIQTLRDLSKTTDIWENEHTNIIESSSNTLIHQINQTEVPDYKGHTLLDGFSHQVDRYPNQIAIIDKYQTYSYKEVNLYANGLAQQLKTAGIQKGDIIAILSEQTFEQIIAAIAIFKVGAIYTPLARNNPASRNIKIMEQAGVKCIITSKSYSEDEYTGVSIIQFEGTQLEYFDDTQNDKKDLAYIIYTSGTTGTPKGVAIKHESAMNTILDINDRLRITADDRAIMLSQMTFDLSVYDIFGMFQAGGGVFIVDEVDRINPEVITYYVKQYSITLWNTVPSLFKLFIQYLEKHPQKDLTINKVLLSGDWIPKDLYKDAKKIINSNIQFYGLGGATEASIWSNIFDLSTLKESDVSVPYGKPLANQRMYILNEQLDLCPIGVIGNLYIAGEGLADCYWNDETKTRQSFFYHSELKQRLYSTGDLAMYRNDGQIIFKGREDGQVKINGYRIELGEIEQNLKQTSYIQDAVVLIDKQLIVAYVASENVEYQIIESDLKKSLPAYMVPKIYFQTDEFPLTQNGKVDRNKLLNEVRFDKEGVSEREWNSLDRQLQNLMKEILEVDTIELNDDFFLLGGDSLKAIQFIQLVKEKLLIELSLKELFEISQLDKLSKYIEETYQNNVEEGEI
ncbi:non-ribosomal peptide synthetase [Mammaliicoccus sciuri]|uniref:non-ribosomal peptide synthetase n=1 Tax=Mammaliicoccus sciuri TaxID=1296 RepID=UPI0021CFB75D|nr:non-ribosomal peptide synthetase [Mammaliicoccus sciuri]UXV29525.1 amino acid adenylation domain-containing protein [Mammaliicoccus sciuri]